MLADESSRLDVNASPGVAASARTYTELEARLFSCNSIEGVALRHGFFYGPKTWYHRGESAANMVMKQQTPVVVLSCWMFFALQNQTKQRHL